MRRFDPSDRFGETQPKRLDGRRSLRRRLSFLSGLLARPAGRRPHSGTAVDVLEPRRLLAADTSLLAPPATPDLPQSIVNADLSGSDTGDDRDPVPYIVNGGDVNAANDPYPAVGIVNGGCTGTLIAPRFVLTAAHCVEGVGDRSATFDVGGVRYESAEITTHPLYDPNDFGDGYDLAIIELRRDVLGIEPVALLRERPILNETLTLVGFGEGGRTGQNPPGDFGTKRAGTTPLDTITARSLDWTVDAPSEANTARGDSGGPVLVRRGADLVLAAVTSGGFGDSHDLGGESFNTRVDVFAAWIDGVAGTAPGGGNNDGNNGGNDDDGEDDGGNDPPADDTGFADVVGYNPLSGDYWAGRSDGQSFISERIGRFSNTVDWGDVLVGDVDANAVADLVRFDQDSGVWWVARSDGDSTTNQTTNQLWARWSGTLDWLDQTTGDFNGDGLTDVAARNSLNGAWYVGLSNGDAFDTALWGRWSNGLDWTEVQAIDINDDGRDDLLTREAQSGAWWAAVSDGTGFTNRRLGAWSADVTWTDIAAADTDADGTLEIVGRNAANGDWYLADLDARRLTLANIRLGRWSLSDNYENVVLANVDDDASLELVGRTAGDGILRVGQFDGAAGSLTTSAWGRTEGRARYTVHVGNFDGDPQDELAFFNRATGVWTVANPSVVPGNSDVFVVTDWNEWSPDDWEIVVGDVVSA